MKLTVANKIGLITLLMSLLVVAASLAGLNGVNNLTKSLDFITTQAWDAADGAMEGTIELQAELLATERMLNGALSVSEGSKIIKESAAGATVALDRMMASGLMDQSQINELNSKLGKYRSSRESVISSFKELSGSDNIAKNPSYIKVKSELDQAASGLLGYLEILDESGDSKVEGEAENISNAQSTAYSSVIIAIIAGIIFSLFSYFAALKTIVKPIRNVADNLQSIAQQGGDLTRSIEVKGNDEIADLANAFNLFMESTSQIIEQVKQSSGEITNESSVLNQIIEDTNNGAMSQKAETEQVASAVTELVATVSSVASHADDASKVSKTADNNSEQGKKRVQETVSNIQKLSQDMDQATSVINEVQAGAQNIGSVLDVIKGIAEQTNLLALNAAIEAARAGEQGRGFAVVADEVRTLASRTQESTTEIQAMIDSLQDGTKNAVNVISKSHVQTEESAKSATLADAALDEIVSAISSISEINHQIAIATKEQEIASSMIGTNAENIYSIAEATADKASAAQASTMQLLSRSSDMAELVSKFKT
ncbi:MAG: HAMP domain-containing protein [Gammaproteobacteria bacterium]|jgi:methyl-accepting chemotaxis protein|nr:HAMP domain-containing protein [Gammaproteobacteria bacterium]MBT4078434.1 HAMP domain-containing protein [Gammaproteobacteria bacterium]MBT6456948.1 HAMP domain-containing protein [Gammaproteobacteria bacterium]MBT7047649.1 HAMP domain-containing protein [Gammaproteobacteria bacterium]